MAVLTATNMDFTPTTTGLMGKLQALKLKRVTRRASLAPNILSQLVIRGRYSQFFLQEQRLKLPLNLTISLLRAALNATIIFSVILLYLLVLNTIALLPSHSQEPVVLMTPIRLCIHTSRVCLTRSINLAGPFKPAPVRPFSSPFQDAIPLLE